jgi:hypothetical protein
MGDIGPQRQRYEVLPDPRDDVRERARLDSDRDRPDHPDEARGERASR